MPNTFALGEAAGGYLGIRTRGSARRDVVERLLARSDLPEIRCLSGIRAVDVSLMTHHVFHRAHLTRIGSGLAE